jgi:hypothetical protein
MLQLAPRGEIAIPMAELEDPYLSHVKTHQALRAMVRRFRPKLRLGLRVRRPIVAGGLGGFHRERSTPDCSASTKSRLASEKPGDGGCRARLLLVLHTVRTLGLSLL